jgi:YVTN family beta-propeller protein
MFRLFSLLFCLFFTKVLFADPFVYVCGGEQANVITVIDAATNQVVATIDNVDSPYAIAITPDGSKAAASSLNNNSVFIIDTATNSLVNTISGTGTGMFQIGITPDGKEVYATSQNSVAYSYDLETYAENHISFGKFSPIVNIVIASDGKTAYAFDSHPNLMAYDFATSTISTFTLLQTTLLSDLAISPDGKTLYASNFTDNKVYIYDTTSHMNTSDIAANSFGIALNSDGTKLLVAAPLLPGVTVVDFTNNTQTTVPFTYSNAAPLSIAITGSTAYVGDNSNNVVTALTFDATEIIATIDNVPVGSSPQAIAITPIKLPPPAQVSVRVCQNKNKFLTQTEYYNVINWNIPTTITPVSYQVYRDPDLTCLAGCVACPTFCDHNVKKCCAYTYYIVALLEDGIKTLIGQTSIR